MANRKKKSGTKKRRYSSRRRRGIGSFGAGFNLTSGVSALGGALAGRVVTQGMKNLKMLDDPKVQDIVRFGVKASGVYVLMTRKSPELQAAAYGLMGELALDIADTKFPNVFGATAVSGIGATVIDLDNISGAGDDYSVSGYDDMTVAGAV